MLDNVKPSMQGRMEDRNKKQEQDSWEDRRMRVFGESELMWYKRNNEDNWIMGRIKKMNSPVSYTITGDHGGERQCHEPDKCDKTREIDKSKVKEEPRNISEEQSEPKPTELRRGTRIRRQTIRPYDEYLGRRGEGDVVGRQRYAQYDR
ncbi:hypothetical protein ACOME3_000304 [Neoechinorhynchus agilis]